MAIEDDCSKRRRFLTGALAAPGVLLIGRQTAWPERSAAAQAPPAKPYQPTYFTETEWAFIVAATDRLIPSDEEGPGAVELGVPEFIDRQMETEYGHGGLWYLQGPFHPEADFALGYQLKFSPRELYREAIAQVNEVCREKHRMDFADLPEGTRDEILASLEKGTIAPSGMKPVEFFIQLHANTIEGYFADPMYGGNRNMGSWKMIGFPGARADFADWAEKPGKVYPLPAVSILGQKG